eukprot:48081_1
MMSGAFLFSSVTIIRIKIYDSFIESSIVSIVLKSHHNPLRYWSNIVLFHQHSFLCQSRSPFHLNDTACVLPFSCFCLLNAPCRSPFLQDLYHSLLDCMTIVHGANIKYENGLITFAIYLLQLRADWFQ